jgi:hypothetical protein
MDSSCIDACTGCIDCCGDGCTGCAYCCCDNDTSRDEHINRSPHAEPRDLDD